MNELTGKIFRKSESKKLRYAAFFSVAVLLLIIAGVMFPSNPVHAFWEEAASGITRWVLYPIVYAVFLVFFYVFYLISWIGASLISANLNPDFMTRVLTAPNIRQGWEIFRDVANLLFILILLLIAIGTIFRSDTYNIKKSLPKLIIVAFLINFSMMLTGLVIDFTNILMYGVLKMMCVAGDNQCFQHFNSQLMGSIMALNKQYTLSGAVSWQGVSAQSAVGLVIATIYTAVFGIILMALAIFLLIRVAVFALLLITSPLAFFGQVAPGLKGLSDKWWDNLLQYAFFGPIFALFLYIAGLMAESTFTVGTSVTLSQGIGVYAELLATIITNIIPLIFLLAIIPITRSMGIAGASAVYSGAALATFGGMAVVGRAWSQGKLFPGQQHITNLGRKAGGEVLKRSSRLNDMWNGKAGSGALGVKGRLKNWKNKARTTARGLGGGRAGRYYDWAERNRAKAETALFKEPKTMGKYADMALRVMNPVLLKKKYKSWLQAAEYENYKIPLGASPDERKKIELMEAHKAVNEYKSIGGYDNPDRVSDKAAEEFHKGNFLQFELLTKGLALQDKQYKVLSSINRKNNLKDTDTDKGAFTPNAKGWERFLNTYKGAVGQDQASNFGQEVGGAAAKESNWSANNIAYYKDGANYIRDFESKELVDKKDPSKGTIGDRDYNEYVKENAKAMGKKSIGSKWNNMSSDNFVEPLPESEKGTTVKFKIAFDPKNPTATEEVVIPVDYKANDQGAEYINYHMSTEEIERNVGKGKGEEMKKIRDGIAYSIEKKEKFIDPKNLEKATKLRDRLTVVLGKP